MAMKFPLVKYIWVIYRLIEIVLNLKVLTKSLLKFFGQYFLILNKKLCVDKAIIYFI